MTNPDAATKAAERLRRQQTPCGGFVSTDFEQFSVDMIAVANAYLAEHPADDDEPIVEAWLLSVGFLRDLNEYEITSPTSDGQFVYLTLTRRGWVLGTGSWSHRSSLLLPATPETRGQLRRLCAALNIPLQPIGQEGTK